MSSQQAVFRTSRHEQSSLPRGRPVGSILMENGALKPSDAVTALAEARRTGAGVSRVVEAEALASPEEVLEAQALHYGAMRLDRSAHPPDSDLLAQIDAAYCLRNAVLPWMWLGDTLVIATSRPETFGDLLDAMPEDHGPVAMALALESDIQDEIADRHAAHLVRTAETLVPEDESCRGMDRMSPATALAAGGLAALGLSLLILRPELFFAFAAGLAALTLLAAQGMKLAALATRFLRERARPASPPHSDPGAAYRPVVTLMVPLYREAEIAGPLVQRLSRLDYPRALLDVLLILEAEDDQTRRVLARTDLPPWMRVVEVPAGQITTKPRAMNYALNVARGDIIGIYDAEDSPAPNHLARVTEHFARSPPQVACLQGILDFYNPRANWLSRCFTIEYATWFRVMLPGLARLGFAIPLGGTTVFFRREALEAVGGWDAHNVTEDADLGVRLARHGFRTELVPIVTREEANCRAWPWVRQRSRWLKGYMITWATHMRAPLRLWRELGAWKFFGVQLIFLTAFLQFLLAPVLWSFWLVLAGLPHPLSPILSPGQMHLLIALFLSSEAVSMLAGLAAVSRSPHPGLLPWVPTLWLYFPLGTIAVYKAVWELLVRPFYWDKTSHGKSAPDTSEVESH